LEINTNILLRQTKKVNKIQTENIYKIHRQGERYFYTVLFPGSNIPLDRAPADGSFHQLMDSSFSRWIITPADRQFLQQMDIWPTDGLLTG
jgi:hypothetical protein